MAIEFVSKPQASNKESIELLEEVLEQARKGEILSVGICTVRTKGQIYDGVAGGSDVAALLGASVMLMNRIARWLE